jgi:hypothetical protein
MHSSYPARVPGTSHLIHGDFLARELLAIDLIQEATPFPRPLQPIKWGQVSHFNKTVFTMFLPSPRDRPCREPCVTNIPARFTI